jgi:antitoxin PrlF
MKITAKGQITVPQVFRTQFGFLPGTDVEFVVDKTGLRLVKSKASQRGARVVKRMRGRGDGKLSTAEIMKLTRG